jgi:hypothetical protein
MPLLTLALLDLRLIVQRALKEKKLKIHALFVSAFPVFAHIAMGFGMLNPSLLGVDTHLHVLIL